MFLTFLRDTIPHIFIFFKLISFFSAIFSGFPRERADTAEKRKREGIRDAVFRHGFDDGEGIVKKPQESQSVREESA